MVYFMAGSKRTRKTFVVEQSESEITKPRTVLTTRNRRHIAFPPHERPSLFPGVIQTTGWKAWLEYLLRTDNEYYKSTLYCVSLTVPLLFLLSHMHDIVK